MAKLVNLPNGSQGSFPDDMDWEQIEAVVQKQFPVEKPKDNRNLLQKSNAAAKKYINEPLQDIGNQALSLGAGAAQGVANTGAGVRNLTAKAANLLPGVNIPMAKSVDIAPNNINSLIGQFGGSMLGGGAVAKGAERAMEIPKHIQSIPTIANAINKIKGSLGKSSGSINKIMKFTKDIGKNAIAGAAVNPEDQGLGALFGGGGAAAGKAIGAAAPAIGNKLGIGEKPGRETLEHLQYSDVGPSVEAANRLGTPLRPSEASKNPYIGGQEGRYTRTSEAAYENVNQGMERQKSEKKAINKLLTTIYDKSTASKNKISNLYQQAYKWNLKPKVIDKLKSDPLIAEAFDTVATDKAWLRKMKGAPENNYAYLDKVRKAMGDQENKLMRAGEKSKAAEYTDARNSLVKIMDKSAPVYAKARAEAQRSIVRSTIEKKLKKEEIRGSEFFKKIIENDQEYNKTLSSLKNVPEAQAQLRDMKDAWHSLINVEKPSTSSYQSEKGLNQARGSLQKIMEVYNSMFGKKKNLESVKFVRNMEQWTKELQQARASGSKSRTESVLSDILGKAFSSGLNVTKEGLKE
jgi:hypothetical protein